MATTNEAPGFWDSTQNLFFDALRSKYVTNDRAADVERVTDDRNIPDRVDVQHGVSAQEPASSFNLMQNKATLAFVSVFSLAGLYLLLRKKGK